MKCNTKELLITGIEDPTFVKTGVLSSEQKKCFQKHGGLLVRAADYAAPKTVASIVKAGQTISAWGETENDAWHYYNMQVQTQDKPKENKCLDLINELIDFVDTDKNGNNNNNDDNGKDSKTETEDKAEEKTRILSRIEKIADFDEFTKWLLSANDSPIMNMVAQLFGEPASLYKDKVNMKLPFDTGFDPHQDHAAGWWSHGHTCHINAFIAIDECTVANGALRVTCDWGGDNRKLLSDKFKGIPEAWVESHDWYHVLMKPGDVFFFTSFTPHQSDPNQTECARRVMIATWNKTSEGAARDQYYADKLKSFPPDILRLKTQNYNYKI